MIRAEHLFFRYGGKAVFEDFSVSFAPGKFHVVLGANGCGKSTLVKLLSGELRPGSGTVSPVFRDPLERARHLAVATQEIPGVIPLAVEEVVSLGAYARGGAEREDLDRILEQAGISALRERMYDTLSGGEKQKVWIARALMQETPILLLDEPASSLDAGFRQKIYRLLRRLAGDGRTVVMVTHDLHLAPQYADRAVLLKEGRILAEGNPEDVLTPGVLREAFDMEAMPEKAGY